MSLGGAEIDFRAADESAVELRRSRRRRYRRGRRGGTGRFLLARGLAVFTSAIQNVPEQFRVLLLPELGLGLERDAAVVACPTGYSSGRRSAQPAGCLKREMSRDRQLDYTGASGGFYFDDFEGK